MTTFTLFEFATVAGNGEPVQPPSVTTTDIAVDTPTRLRAGTIYAAVVASADMYFAVGDASITAGAKMSKVLLGETRGFPVSLGARPYVAGH